MLETDTKYIIRRCNNDPSAENLSIYGTLERVSFLFRFVSTFFMVILFKDDLDIYFCRYESLESNQLSSFYLFRFEIGFIAEIQKIIGRWKYSLNCYFVIFCDLNSRRKHFRNICPMKIELTGNHFKVMYQVHYHYYYYLSIESITIWFLDVDQVIFHWLCFIERW